MLTQHTARIGRSRAEHARLQEQVASGKRVSRPSDDPRAFSQLERLSHRLSQLEGAGDVAAASRTRLETADNALDNMHNTLSRVRELTIQGMNSSYNTNDRADIVAELRQLGDHFQTLTSTRIDGEYVFSGTKTDTPPLADDGSYQGGGPGTVVEIGDNTRIDVAVLGEQLFDGDVNIVQLLNEMADQMEADDIDALGNNLANLDQAEEQLIIGRTDVGARLSRIDVAENLTQDVRLGLLKEQQDVGDTDVASAISELLVQERSLQAAVQVAGRSIQPSLLDIL
jgi:flagellar hook-associated protein 3 FlgL